MNRSYKIALSLTAGFLSLSLLSAWLLYFRHRAYTDDAYVQGNLVTITPLQDGFVQSILTDDTFLVRKGQLLALLDNTNALLALDGAKEQLAIKVREIAGAFHELFALQAEVQAEKADFLQAVQDYEHRLAVLEIGGVSVEDFEHAEASLKRSFFLLMQTESLVRKQQAFLLGTAIATHPEVLAKIDLAKQAFVNLHRTKIYSPVEGLVAQRTVQVGTWISAGTPLMAVIPLDQIWVNANFKETQMKRMRIGQHVTLTSDLYGKDAVFQGTIIGLPGGAGNIFSLLPPQNLSGNWIKIVQRLPVRVALDPHALSHYPLRLGLSMKATVDLRKSGPLVPDSTQEAPHYTTDIFTQEEEGDISWIEEIIRANSDPSLSDHLFIPLLPPPSCS
ncbi:MAG: HlyD family efflux transporter periplasmic adaptor subunit [Chlamydiae bacterium]|nr:HlyD family efflux transporter periplasmic adaptor subunit [Chlamydiota bacterium]